MRTRVFTLLLAVGLVLGIPGDGAPRVQDPDDGPIVLQVNTRLVQVDVAVLDDDGPVEGLTAADFTVIDEGVERPIEVFNVTRARPEGEEDEDFVMPPGAVSNRLDWKGRPPTTATAILMDRFNTLGGDQAYMDSQARDFIDDAVENDDPVAVFEFSDEGLKVLGDFKDKPEGIRDNLENARPIHSLALENSLGALDDNQVDPALAAMSGGSAPSEFEQQVSDFYLGLRADQTTAALEAITRQLADLPGRKNLVWLASSFPFTFDPHQNTHMYDALPFSTLDRIEEVARTMTDLNIAIYPVDVRGLRDTEPTEISIMETLAQMTGGRASYNYNGLATAMREAVRDAEVTYTLGFYVDESEDDTDFHDLDVRVAREDVDVRHRRGYYGFGGEPPVSQGTGLEEALTRAYDATGLGLVARALPRDDEPGVYKLTVIVDVHDMGLSRRDDRWIGSLNGILYFYSVDNEDAVVIPSETYPVNLTEELYQVANATGFILSREVDTEGQSGYLRVLIEDAGTGATGSVWLPVGLDD